MKHAKHRGKLLTFWLLPACAEAERARTHTQVSFWSPPLPATPMHEALGFRKTDPDSALDTAFVKKLPRPLNKWPNTTLVYSNHFLLGIDSAPDCPCGGGWAAQPPEHAK
eukprot:12890385-Alexandrium_andersonii.AAC.1